MKIHRKRLWIELIVAAVAIVCLLIYAIPRFLRAQLVDSITESDCVFSEGAWEWDGSNVKQTGPIVGESFVLFFRPSITQGEIQFKAYLDTALGLLDIYFGLKKPYNRRFSWDISGFYGNKTGIMEMTVESATSRTLGNRTDLNPFPYVPKKWYDFRLVVRDGGRTVEGYVDGELIQTYKSVAPFHGQFGIGIWNTSAAEFRDIRVVKDYRD